MSRERSHQKLDLLNEKYLYSNSKIFYILRN